MANRCNVFQIESEHRQLFMSWNYKPSSLPPKVELADLNLNLSPDSDHEIFGALEKAGAGGVKGEVRNAIEIKTTVADDYSRLGSSRFGGFPDLKNETDLPTAGDKVWFFMAQINLQDTNGLCDYLPHEGLLSFFVPSLESRECQVIFQQGPLEKLQTVRFSPAKMIDDQDDYTQTPFRVELCSKPDLPSSPPDQADQTAYDSVCQSYCVSGEHSINGYTFTQGKSPEEMAADRHGGKPCEWVNLLKLGWDKKVGFCFWDAGTVTFTIHREALRRHDFSNVVMSLYSS